MPTCSMVDFDDSTWANAKEFSEERVNPKEPFYAADFKGAKFIWSNDLDLEYDHFSHARRKAGVEAALEYEART